MSKIKLSRRNELMYGLMHELFPDTFKNRGSFQRYRKDIRKAQAKASYIKNHYGSAYEYKSPSSIISMVWKDISLHEGEVRQSLYEEWLSSNLKTLKELKRPTRDIVQRQRKAFLLSVKKSIDYANNPKTLSSYQYLVNLISNMSDYAFGRFISGNKALKSIMEISNYGIIYSSTYGMVARDETARKKYINAHPELWEMSEKDLEDNAPYVNKKIFNRLIKETSEEQNLGLSSMIARATNAIKSAETHELLKKEERKWRRKHRETR